MRFVITGEWSRNRLLQTIVGLYSLYVIGLWWTNALLFFNKMSLSYGSVVSYYLGNEEQFLSPRTYQGMLEVSHFHLFAMGMLLLVLTHLVLFVPLKGSVKAWLVALPFVGVFVDIAAMWLKIYISPIFFWLHIPGGGLFGAVFFIVTIRAMKEMWWVRKNFAE